MAETYKMHFLVYGFIEIFLVNYLLSFGLSQGACRFGSGNGCAFQCHCQDDCDPDTGCNGRCTDGSPSGTAWGAPACQVGNVALYKSANQTGVYNGLTADRAVDGWLGTSQENCAHPKADSPQTAGWTVDLEDTYFIYNVTVYNTYNTGGDFRLEQFDIFTQLSANNQLQSCGSRYSPVSRGGNFTVSCGTSGRTGRYVHFRRYGGRQPHLVTLCEVVVIGYRYIDCQTCTGSCDSVTGCSSCPSGQKLPDCSDCDARTYGDNCQQTCRCQNNDVCDRRSGACPSGCQMWYVPDPTCQLHIASRGYGSGEGLVTSRDVTSSSVTVQWQPRDDIDQSVGSYYLYRLQYRPESGGDFVQVGTNNHPTSDTSLTRQISGLSADTSYRVRVDLARVWFSEPQYSQETTETTFKTTCASPGTPKIESAVVTYQSNGDLEGISVTYQLPGDSGCSGDGFQSQILEFRQKDDPDWTTRDISGDPSSYVLYPTPEAFYVTRVTVTNRDGQSASSTESTVVYFVRPPPTTTSTTTSSTPSPGGNNTTLIAAVVVVVVVVVVVLVVVLVLLARKGIINMPSISIGKPKRKKYDKRTIELMGDGGTMTHGIDNPIIAPKPKVANKSKVSSGDIESVNMEADGDDVNIYLNAPKAGPVTLDELEDYVELRKGDSQGLIAEYKKLPQDEHRECNVAQKEENKSKNRFLNIYAYDHSRVHLKLIDGDPHSDYINANYIQDYKKKKAFIATQGPRPQTFYDFWRMIWQEEANRIVMVTNLVENTKKKCDQYWPEGVGKSKTYEDFEVTQEAEEVFADYTIRMFKVTLEGETRPIRQFHFTSWEDKKRPLYGAAPILAFRRKIHSFDRLSTGPLVIHCSAGVGRTGTLISIDILLEQAEQEERVDFFGCVKNLREDRMSMVQTKDQYIFLHDAILEAIKSGDTAYPCNNFQTHFASIYKRKPGQQTSELERQFDLLCSLKNQNPTKNKEGWKDSNRAKNRDADIIPEDRDRPYLMTRYAKGNNYINAVYVDGFKGHDAFIATQLPLQNTVVDLWRLVHDHNITVIIMLHELDKTDQRCPEYWPDEDEPKQRYGPLEVELVKQDKTSFKNVVIRDFRVSLFSEKPKSGEPAGVQTVVRQLQLLGWSHDQELPPIKRDILDLIDQLQRWQQQTPNRSSKVNKAIIQSYDGGCGSGLFCAVAHTLDKLKVDQEIDAFLAVRYVANRRPQFVSTQEQYKFLYEMAIAYMSQFDTYANFQ